MPDAEISKFSREIIILIGTGIGLAILGVLAAIVRKSRKWIIKRAASILQGHYPKKKDAEQNQDVYTELVELRALAGADRTAVIRFHNGTEFLPANPIWKISCTHEVVKSGVTYEAESLQGLLVPRISPLIDPVITGKPDSDGVSLSTFCSGCRLRPNCDEDNKYIVVVQIDELTGGYGKFLFEGQNVKTLVMVGMINHGNVFGIVMAEFCDAKVSDPEALEAIGKHVCQSAWRLQYLFQNKKAPQSDSPF